MQGMVLTATNNLTGFLNNMRGNYLSLLKVVTGWGVEGGWHGGNISQVCQTMPTVLVRTTNGDGCRPPPPGQSMIFLDPSVILAEIAPWCQARQQIWIELGNEPNNSNTNAANASDDAAWCFRYWFEQTLLAVRQHYPSARIITPGLFLNRQYEWWAICADVFRQADAIGFHSYDYRTPGDKGELQAAFSQLRQFFPGKSWALTEYGINDPPTPPATKAGHYSQLHKDIASQAVVACFYHYTWKPDNPDQQAYNLPYDSWSALKAKGKY